MGRDGDRQHDRALRAERLGELGAGLDGGALARDDDLARGVAVGDDEDAVRRRPPRPARGAARRRGRSARPSPRRGPGPDACIRRPRSRTRRTPSSRRDGAGGDERRVLAHRMAGGERAGWRRAAVGGPALAQRREDRDRGGEERRLGVLGQVELVGRAVPGEPADRLAERGVGRGEDGRGGRARRRRGPGPSRPTGSPGRERRRRSGDIVRASVGARSPTLRANSPCTVAYVVRRAYACGVPDRPSSDAASDAAPRPLATIARRFEADLSAPGPGGRQPAPERPPDQRARGDGPGALARAGHRVRRPARGAAPRLHPARRRCTSWPTAAP